MKKILIVYATAGEGHKRAAFAIHDAFNILSQPEIEIKLINALDYTNRFFKWLYPFVYIFMVTYIPTIWGFGYYCLDFKWLYPLVRFVRRVVNKNNTKHFEEFLCNYNPDVVVTTHFLATEVISNLKRQSKIKTKLITCVTDFRMHSFWFSKETDFFCVGFQETKYDLIKKWKIPAEKINILGIPVHPKFYDVKNKDEICNKLNISKGLFTILITGGGFGVGPIMALVKTLISVEEKLQTLVVCGHNEKLRQQLNKLSSIQYPPPQRLADPPKRVSASAQAEVSSIKTFGFIDYVDELMTVSDVGITKAGGLICSEALAKELPLIIISPIPGQESRNCRLLLENNTAFRINRPGEIKNIIKEMYFNDNLLNGMKGNIKKIKKENPAISIARFALQNTDEHR